MRETDGKTLGNPIAGGHIIPRIGFTDVAASDVCVCSLLVFPPFRFNRRRRRVTLLGVYVET
jgi:hypothetical protein